MRKRETGAGIVAVGLFILLARFLSGGDSPSQPAFTIASPKDGAAIPSAFVALSGTAPAGQCLMATLDTQSSRTTCADSSGHFGMVVRAEKGAHILRIAPKDAVSFSAAMIRIQVNPPQINPPPEAALAVARWDLLQEGDIILSHSDQSPQIALYDPVFTHAALYLGAGANGAALVAEAVSEESAGGLGQVRSVPIEQTLAWNTAQGVKLFRLQAGLDAQKRESILRFARATVDRGLKFWTPSDDFGAVYSVWLEWDSQRDRPFDRVRFQRALDGLRARKFSDQRFNCTTLVWRSYWEGSNGQIDLASPNRMGLGGQLTRAFSLAFLSQVLPDFITPDSLYFSGKLARVGPDQ